MASVFLGFKIQNIAVLHTATWGENDFCALVESGVFHDAMGKTLNVFENWGQLCAEVETEY